MRVLGVIQPALLPDVAQTACQAAATASVARVGLAAAHKARVSSQR